MNKMNFLLSVAAGTLVYVLVNLFFGSSGLWAEHQLVKQKHQLTENISKIEKIHEELLVEYTALKNDPEVVASYARRLGFVMEGEHLVKFTGISNMSEKVYSTGKYYVCTPINFVPEWICKLLGICVFLLCMILSLLLNLPKKQNSIKIRRETEVLSVNP